MVEGNTYDNVGVVYVVIVVIMMTVLINRGGAPGMRFLEGIVKARVTD